MAYAILKILKFILINYVVMFRSTVALCTLSYQYCTANPAANQKVDACQDEQYLRAARSCLTPLQTYNEHDDSG
jgi:hypothetical protein